MTRQIFKTDKPKYIYDPRRANEFLQYGFRCYETGFNARRQRCYWVFDYEEVQPYYEKQK